MLTRISAGTVVLLMTAWLLGGLLLLCGLVASDLRRSGQSLLGIRSDSVKFGAAVLLALVVPPGILGIAWLLVR